MKLNTRARYALRAMIQITRANQDGRPVSLGDIAADTSISRRYLEQLVIPLKNASLIRGISGKGGGYVLAKAPERIRVRDIFEAVIGPINIVDCVSDPRSCMMFEWCECRPLYVLLNDRLTEALDSLTVADLSDSSTGGAGVFAGSRCLEGASYAGSV